VRPIGSRIRLIVAVVLVALVLTAILATQHFLLSPFSSVSISGIKANCTGVIEDSTKGSVTVGSGTILFGCNSRTGWPPTGLACSGGCPGAYPVFNVSQTGDYTPIFNLPHYYTSLFVAGTDGCSPLAASGSPPSQLTNGTRMQLSGSGSSPSSYYYCASYASVGSSGATLITFTISWRSGSTLFTQTFPSVRVPPQPPPSGFSGCSAASLDSVTPATPVNGFLEFDCVDSAGPYHALTVSIAGYYTPTFTLPQYYAGLSITPIADTVSNCTALASGNTAPTPLTNGTQMYLNSNLGSGGYYYCANYAGVPGSGSTLPSFTVSWSSGSTLILAQTIPSVTVPAKTSAVAVVRGVDNGLYYSTMAGSWSGWKSLGGSTAGPAIFCSGGGGSLYLAVRGSDNVSIYIRSYSNGAWSPWISPGGGATAEPACASMNGTLHLLVRGVDYGLWYNSLNETSGIWSGWLSLGGSLDSPPALAASPSLGRLDVVLAGASGAIWHKALSNGVWQNWDPLTGSTSDTPAVSSDGISLHLVIRGTDNGLYYSALNFTTSSWSGWVSLVGTTGITPSLATDSSGTVHLFVVGADRQIYDKSLAPGGVWSTSWDAPGGTTSNPVAIAAQGPNIAIVVSGTTGGVWYNTLVGSIWQGWTSLGGSTSLAPALSTIS
jgi:hypothetical protein